MTGRPVPVRDDLAELTGYHSPQVDVEVRLNTNESPVARRPTSGATSCGPRSVAIEFHRYPDRSAEALRRALAEFHGVDAGPGVLRQRLERGPAVSPSRLRRGRADRRRCSNRPTRCTATSPRSRRRRWSSGWRMPDHSLDLDGGRHAPGRCTTDHHLPVLAQQPDRPVRASRRRGPRARAGARSGGGRRGLRPVRARQRSRSSAPGGAGVGPLVVLRTFSKTWSMAACRLGYLVADPDVVGACERWPCRTTSTP